MVSYDVFTQWAACAKVKEVADKFEKYVLDSAWWKAADFFRKLMELPYVTMRRTDSATKGMMAHMYNLMLQLTEDMRAMLDGDQQQLSEEDKEHVGEFLKRRARRIRLGYEKCHDLVFVAHNWLVVHNAHKHPAEEEGAGIIDGNISDPSVPGGYILQEEGGAEVG
ncbi:unnamed protein product [Closterium sp. Naga37s-1]|nr:unnamed protein product [Closterium sp. Naga37s-1]